MFILSSPVLGAASKSVEPFLVLTAFIAFPALWCLVVGSLAKVGGWQQLAETYSIEQYPDRFRQKGGVQTIRINNTRYKNAVTIDYDEYGLYMQTLILFRIGHALLYIPWEDIAIHPKAKNLFGFDFMRELTFKQKPEVKVVFPKSLIQKIANFSDVDIM